MTPLALLLALALAGPPAQPAGPSPLPTRPWLERKGAAVVLSVDAAGLFDDALRTRLQSGLSITLRLELELRELDDDTIVGVGRRVARVRWDLWDERLAAVIDDPRGAREDIWPSIEAFVQHFAAVDRVPVAGSVPVDARVMRAVLRLEVNPVGANELARMRSWLSAPEGAVSDPFASGVLGSFVRLFDNLKPGIAERVVTLAGQPVRADRLPLVERAAPGPPPPEGG